MASLKAWEDSGGPALHSLGDGGLTLLELLMSVAILSILIVIAFPIGWTFYLDYQIDSERNTLVALLENSRNSAMTNIGEADHGLYLDGNQFVAFRGESYAARDAAKDKTLPRNNDIAISGPTELVFSALSGATALSIYTLNNGRKTFNVYVNSEGRIEF